MKGKGTVFVGLSGGVDSSVAALRLKNAGYDVVGVFIKVWHPDFLVCNWEAERLDAMRAAAHLGIPFLTCDAEEAYKREVGEYFVREYEAGRTPNPDVLCNKEIKFGAFLDFARTHGADFVATGHYAQKDGMSLRRGRDANKDQSYFLWTLRKDQLTHILFPVGMDTKDVIRAEAARAGLPAAIKKDSQGICFLGHVDIPEFLSHFVTLTEGSVLNARGEVVGKHGGAIAYTLGQRHGFTLTNADVKRAPQYIIAKNIETNTITVDAAPPTLAERDTIRLASCNWIGEVPAENKEYAAQFRYRQTPFAVRLSDITGSSCALHLEARTERPASGQSCVLYDGDVCLGGGVIE